MRGATNRVKGCAPRLPFLDPGGLVSGLVGAGWIVDEHECRLPVARNALGDVLHVWGFGHRVPAAFVLEHDLGAVCLG